MSPILKRTGLLCAIALAIGAAVFTDIYVSHSIRSYYFSDRQTAAVDDVIAGVKIGGPFSLTDQNGNLVTEKSYPGKYRLVYFGFSSCPMICPTGLQKIAKALNALGPEAEKIQPILITVDPERDQPDVLRQYVKQFHPRLVGLTGPKADIEAVEKSYAVYAAKTQDASASDYTMDHSAFTYFLDPEGNLLALYHAGDNAQAMADDLKRKLQGSENP